MHRIFVLLVCLVVFFSTSEAQHQSRVSLNHAWKFILDSVNSYSQVEVDDASWRSLDLPHDWSIEGAFDKNHPAGTGGGALPGGMGWYRKTFYISKSQKDKQVFIEFDGVYRNSEVFINGHSLGIRPNGYISFQYDLTPYLHYGKKKNLLAVKVDNSKQPNSRWYSGSGIYRNVWLTVVNKIHFDHWGVSVTTPQVNADNAMVKVSTSITNNTGYQQHLEMVYEIFDEQGRKVANSWNSLLTDSLASVSGVITIANPQLWSVERPYLYTLVTKIYSWGKIIDSYQSTFGIRYFHFDEEKGFSLNGKPVKILGVCNHHDLGALGAAINTRALERQLEILKEMGCNGIRTSHNPPAPELLDLADRMGFIMMDEAFDMWKRSKTKYDYSLDWDRWHKKDLEDLIKRDRNHPSVFIWSVGNEIGEQWGDDTSGRNIARELVNIVMQHDSTRPVTTANNEVSQWNNLIQSRAFQLVGYNYNHQRWKDFKKDWPGKKMIVTESTSALQTRGYYDLLPYDSIRRWPEAWDKPFNDGNKDLTVSAYDHVSAPWGSTHEESIRELLKHDHVSGMYIWTGFDYLGEPTPYPWPARSSYFGIIDLAGFPKDVYYLYQSLFTGKPVLHLYPHWNWNAGDTVDVVSYYNQADEVELFLDGRSLGKRSKKDDELHVKWRVPYSPGTLKAVSRMNGIKVLTREVKTAGDAYAIVLSADRDTIAADGKDLSFVTVNIVDKNGVLVPGANNMVQFNISGWGFIAGVDNGSPVSLEPFKAGRHTAMNGKALCIIQSVGRKGSIKLIASADGLVSSSIELEAQ